MAYACPVCDQPQVDAAHLADHVAFTAITGDDAHEAWLDETVEDWAALGQAELADVVVDHAAETEFPLDIDAEEAGADAGHPHDHGDGAGGGHERAHRGPPASRASADDDRVHDVLADAREMTLRMHGDADGTTGDETAVGGDENADGDDETDADGTTGDETAVDADGETDADGEEKADDADDPDNETQ